MMERVAEVSSWPGAKFLSRSTGVRTFFARQRLLFSVAIALFAILWVTNVRGPGTGFVSVLLYTFFIGNLTIPVMTHLAPLSWQFRFPFNWAVYLMSLFLTAVASMALTVAIMMAVYRASFGSFFAQFWSTGKLPVI